MGMCKPSGGIKNVYGPYRSNIKPLIDTPNTRTDYYDEKTGKLLQQRWYDHNGAAVWDRDWDHNDPFKNHTFPHDHYWKYLKNKNDRPEYIGPNNEKTKTSYC